MVLYLPILKWIEDMFNKFEDIKSIMDNYVIFEDMFNKFEDIKSIMDNYVIFEDIF